MKCQCCGQQRETIRAVSSDLATGVKILKCDPCRKSGHEPRFVVIMAAKSGIDVKPYVVNKNYCGKVITATEII